MRTRVYRADERVVTEASKLRVPVKRLLGKARAAERERAFLANLAALGVPVPIPEYRFHPNRRFRSDYAYPYARLAIEVEGGVWTRGKHGRGSGILKDMEKGNEYARLGWRLIRVTPDQLAQPETAELVRDALRVAP